MEPDYSISGEETSEKTLIPGMTNNKKGMQKFWGVVLIASVLNQTTFIFERNNTIAFEKYFASGNDDYEPELVRSWWFATQFISSLFSIWIVTKIQPTFYYGIVTVIFGVAQFVLAFFEKDKLEGYAPIMGITGGFASGSVLLVPIYLLWRHFSANMKGIVIAAYFVCTGFLSNCVIYFVLRIIWWGQAALPDGPEETKK